MKTGKLAGVLCPLVGWNLIYTAPRGEHGTVTLSIASIDSSGIQVSVSHVKQGNAGAGEPRADSDIIMSPITITNNTVTISELGIESLDDLYVYSSVVSKAAVSVSTQGLEHKREVLTRR